MQSEFTPVPLDDEDLPEISEAEERAEFLQSIQLDELIDDSPAEATIQTSGACVKIVVLLLLLGAVFFGSAKSSADHQDGLLSRLTS